MTRVLIYGANGFTGRLCAERAVRRGLRPVLAGRRGDAVAALASSLGLDYRVGAVESIDLGGIGLVLHCAGPFSATSRPMLDACLAARAHYLDVTGEVAVFEAIFARRQEIEAAGIVALPGVGFDVVPTDCLAYRLLLELPSACRLELAFAGIGGALSRGTARTMVEGLRHGPVARIDGQIKSVPYGWRTRRVLLGDRERTVTSIGWGDVSTAFHSTGIPDITTYTPVPRRATNWLRRTRLLAPLLGTRAVQSFLKRRVDARCHGPTREQQASGVMHVWGRVEDAVGHAVEGRVRTPEGYRFTALAAIAAVERVLAEDLTPGPKTPSDAFGWEFLEEIEGVIVEPLVTLA